MTRITHVLCPVDLSETSQHALDHAVAIAGWYDARLTVLYVFTTLPTMDLPPLILGDQDRGKLLTSLKNMAVRVPSSVHCEFRITEAGFVHDEIVAQIAATQADVLVLGTHGRSGFQRLFLGSVTEKVIRKATCPVLVVPPRAPDVAPEAPVQFKRILCAVDFSASSLSALEQALTLSQEADAQLHLLHVIETPTELREGPWVAATLLEEFRERAVVDAQRRLLDLVPEQARTFCTVDTRVTEGRAYKQVLEQALAQEADLIVMGARGRDALDRLVFGSTTHYVIRAAACPVLVIRTP